MLLHDVIIAIGRSDDINYASTAIADIDCVEQRCRPCFSGAFACPSIFYCCPLGGSLCHLVTSPHETVYAEGSAEEGAATMAK